MAARRAAAGDGDDELPEVAAALRALAARRADDDSDEGEVEATPITRSLNAGDLPEQVIARRLQAVEVELGALRDELAVAQQRAAERETEAKALRLQLTERHRRSLMQPGGVDAIVRQRAERELKIKKRAAKRHQRICLISAAQERVLMRREDPLFAPAPPDMQEQERIAWQGVGGRDDHLSLAPSIGADTSSVDDEYVNASVRTSAFKDQLGKLKGDLHPVLREFKDSSDKALTTVYHILWPVVGKHPHPKVAFIRAAKAQMVKTKVLLADAVRCVNAALTGMVRAEKSVRSSWQERQEREKLEAQRDAECEADFPAPPSETELQLQKEVALLRQRMKAERTERVAKEQQLTTQRDHLLVYLRNTQDRAMSLHHQVYHALHQVYKHRMRWTERYWDPLREFQHSKDGRRPHDHARYNLALAEALDASARLVRRFGDYALSDELWGVDMAANRRQSNPLRSPSVHSASPGSARRHSGAFGRRRSSTRGTVDAAKDTARVRRETDPQSAQNTNVRLGVDGRNSVTSLVGVDVDAQSEAGSPAGSQQPAENSSKAMVGFAFGDPVTPDTRNLSAVISGLAAEPQDERARRVSLVDTPVGDGDSPQPITASRSILKGSSRLSAAASSAGGDSPLSVTPPPEASREARVTSRADVGTATCPDLLEGLVAELARAQPQAPRRPSLPAVASAPTRDVSPLPLPLQPSGSANRLPGRQSIAIDRRLPLGRKSSRTSFPDLSAAEQPAPTELQPLPPKSDRKDSVVADPAAVPATDGRRRLSSPVTGTTLAGPPRRPSTASRVPASGQMRAVSEGWSVQGVAAGVVTTPPDSRVTERQPVPPPLPAPPGPRGRSGSGVAGERPQRRAQRPQDTAKRSPPPRAASKPVSPPAHIGGDFTVTPLLKGA
eukprot:TRINITY_DN15286_c0_g1_i1.p1 TRINITY_DN15286_c0_g1~~TRINITY_DN15286_c0_g1_i1.p1  ORF type:complete len:916 (+),score=297.56 TRINITY_DN15286_c0_g1_i1:56-2749(+)